MSRSTALRIRFVKFAVCFALAAFCAVSLLAQHAPRKNRAHGFVEGPKPGTLAPDFELPTIDGQTVRGSELWTNQPTVILAGSHTCPVFRGKVDAFGQLV